MIAKTRIRGEMMPISPPLDDISGPVFSTIVGVTVEVGVLVCAGKIKVIAGNGTKVVVGVSVGDDEGVNVWVGPLVGLGVLDSVTNASTSACTGNALTKINMHKERVNVTFPKLFIRMAIDISLCTLFTG